MSMGRIVAAAMAIAVALDAQAMPLGIRIAVMGRASQRQAVPSNVPAEPEAPEEEEMPFAVELLDQNTVRVNGFLDDDERVSSLVIPDTIGGKAVVEIAAGAFANSKCGMETLSVPLFCTNIGDKAFMGVASLKSVVFPDTRRWNDPSIPAELTIGRYAFPVQD